MDDPPFPFNRLPHVAKWGVIKNMDPLALFFLSQTSRKPHALMKSAPKKGAFHLKLQDHTSEKLITFGYGEQRSYLRIVSNRENTWPIANLILSDGNVITIGYHRVSKDIIIYESDGIEGFKRIIKLLVDTFSAKSVSFHIADLELMKPIISFTKSIGLKFEKCQYTRVTMNASDNEYLLDEFKNASKLTIIPRPRETIEYRNLHLLTLKCLTIRYAQAITLANLYSLMNCKTIKLSKIYLTNQELREFVRKWMLGGCNLEYLQLDPKGDIDLPMVVRGFNAVMVEEVMVKNQGTRRIGPSQCYSFQRNDGVKAKLYVHRR